MRKFIVTFDEDADDVICSIVKGEECEITDGILRIGGYRADMNYVVGIYEQTVEGHAKFERVGGSE